MSDLARLSLDFASLQSAYAAGATPAEVAEEICRRIDAHSENPIWIERVPREALLQRARSLADDATAGKVLPLYGLPFAVKDNIDAAGLPTTAACPDFSYLPARNATVVQRLLDAGAMLVGKTNLDQFATGLVGTRSPYGAVRNAFKPAYVSGGSSSGSAVAVALGMASFALGTDTAGSGRVPAAFNNLVGLKPTRGLVSIAGVVPACRSLDCVSVFALCCDDAERALAVAAAPDPLDPFSRAQPVSQIDFPEALRFGVPRTADLEFFGDAESPALFAHAVERLANLGAMPVEVDLGPFLGAADLLYHGPWIAERTCAVGEFIDAHPASVLPVTSTIINSGKRFNAVDTFRAMYRLAELRKATEDVWEAIDVLLLPTAATIYTIAEVEREPTELNSNLGRYTNFVNLLDLAAIAVPSGFRRDGLPFGVTLAAPAGRDLALCRLGTRLQREAGLALGATPHALPHASAVTALPLAGTICVAVIGAHLSGEPLNHQLTERGARLLRACRTAPRYRLYALPGSTPAKPGLVRADTGTAIELEVWEMPERHFGSFVAGIPAPLGIGTVELDDGTSAKGFLCESYATQDATDISCHGGWRAFLAAQPSAPAFAGRTSAESGGKL
jgi:allophanate hydrolase